MMFSRIISIYSSIFMHMYFPVDREIRLDIPKVEESEMINPIYPDLLPFQLYDPPLPFPSPENNIDGVNFV